MTDMQSNQADIDAIKAEAANLQSIANAVTSSLLAMKKAFESFALVANAAAPEKAIKAQEATFALEEAKIHASNYSEYNKLLRSWFVAFGIGGIALLYTKPELLSSISTCIKWSIIGAFLVGSAAQIFVAFINKVMSWRLHEAENWRATGESRSAITHATDGRKRQLIKRKERLKVWENRWRPVSEMFWIDLVCDFLSLLCFSYVVVIILISPFIWVSSISPPFI